MWWLFRFASSRATDTVTKLYMHLYWATFISPCFKATFCSILSCLQCHMLRWVKLSRRLTAPLRTSMHSGVTRQSQHIEKLIFSKHADYTTSPLKQMFPLQFIIRQSSKFCTHGDRLLLSLCTCVLSLLNWHLFWCHTTHFCSRHSFQFEFTVICTVWFLMALQTGTLFNSVFLWPISLFAGKDEEMHLINIITHSRWWIGTLCPFVFLILAL